MRHAAALNELMDLPDNDLLDLLLRRQATRRARWIPKRRERSARDAAKPTELKPKERRYETL